MYVTATKAPALQAALWRGEGGARCFCELQAKQGEGKAGLL